MSSNKTTNYQLHSWEAGDDFLRTEFNENFEAIDVAIGGLIVAGTYRGNDQAEQFISLGFTPRAVLIVSQDGQMANSISSGTMYFLGGLALRNSCVSGSAGVVAQIETNGFRVYGNGNRYANQGNMTYHYLAIR